MKKGLLCLSLLALLASCGSGGGSASSSGSSSQGGGGSSTSQTSSSSESSSSASGSSTSSGDDIPDIIDTGSDDDPDNLSIQNSPILHAWDWSTDLVKNNLDNIKNAGFKAVQLSPLQPSKSKSADSDWWNLYQPLGFKVSDNDENPLGNKTSLKQLTTAADKKGIKIIVDVVTNHLAGDNNNFDGQVGRYEPDIYNNNMQHGIGPVTADDYNSGNREKIVRGAIGMPDLKTESSLVQDHVASMLKQYLDCGVKGFRFDAAKHIETPDDNSSYKSDYWPNVLKAAKDYAKQKGYDEPYAYGEILNRPAISWDAYTKHISVTDSDQGTDIMEGVKNGDANKASNGNYNTGNASKTILWAESHDTFLHPGDGNTTFYTDGKFIDMAYAIQVSRKDATALYFGRPAGSELRENNPDKYRQKISNILEDYKSNVVAAANKFHTDFIGANESLSNDNKCVVNVRKMSNNEGALIADLEFSNSKTVRVGGLSNGEYTDIVTNRKYQVNDGSVTVNFTKGICVLEKDTSGRRPTTSVPAVSVSATQTSFKTKTSVTVTASDATLSYYQVNDGKKVLFTNTATFEVGEYEKVGDIVIKVAAQNDNGGKTATLTVTKVEEVTITKDVGIINVPSDINLLAWVWKSNSGGKWINLDKLGQTARQADMPGNEDKIIFAIFPKGKTASSANWDDVEKQTNDLSVSTKKFDYNDSSIWKQ